MDLIKTAAGRMIGCFLLTAVMMFLPLKAQAAPWRDPSSAENVRKVVSVNKLSSGMQAEKSRAWPDLSGIVLDTGRKPKLAALKEKLKKKVIGLSGNFSIYVKDLKTGESISINNRRMYAASLIKLYAMGAAYEKIGSGKLKEDEVSGKIRRMIASSDNSCFNSLVMKVGLDYTNRWISSHGFADTKVCHGCKPADNSFGTRSASSLNRTSAADCALFLESVYRGKCVSRAYSKKMLEHLKAQTRRGKIPAGVPLGVTVANKTGETDDTSHDAAIVYSPGGDYILVVMVTAPGNGWNKPGEIAAISRMTYAYFNRK